MKKSYLGFIFTAMLVSLSGCSGQNTSVANNSTDTISANIKDTSQEQASKTDDSSPSPDKVYTINCGISIASGTPRDQSCDVCYAETFGEYVEEHSNGAIQFELFYGNSLGSDADVVAGISNGTIEFYCGDITTISSYYNPALLFSIPGAIPSLEGANKLFESEWGQKFFDGCAEQTGIRILSSIGKGFRNFTTVDKPLKTPADINGLSLRVLNNPLYIEMVNSLSASAVPMDISELYTALQNGVVDGHENSIPNILQDKTYELEKHLVLDAHTGSYFCGIISDSFYQSLPADLQQVILDADKAARKAASETVDKILTEGKKTLQDNGVTIYEPTEDELKEWHAAYSEQCMDLAKKEMGEDVVQDFINAIDTYCTN